MDNFLKQAYQPKKKCSRCKETFNWPENFNKKGKNKNGEIKYRSECKKCSYKEYSNWKVKHPNITKYNNIARRKLVEKCRSFMIEYLLKNPCVDCGNNDIRVLEFDHIKEKNVDVSRLLSRGRLKQLQEEIQLCEVVCSNCHRIRTMVRGNHYRHIYKQQIRNGE